MTLKICQLCKREFKCSRRDRRHCSKSCKSAARSNRESPIPSETMLSLGLVLKSAAPEGTIGYRLGLPVRRSSRRAGLVPVPLATNTAQEMIWFPPAHQRSLRWDGSYSEQPYFVLTRSAFEPPRVPVAASYRIEFIAATGLILQTPSMLESGVRVAESSRMSWPGTHNVRQARQGSVRTVVELVSRAKKE